MGAELLQQFLGQDCDLARREELCNEIGSLISRNDKVIRELTFNRFILTVDLVQGIVRLEDDLDTSERGAVVFPIHQFLDDLKASS